MNETTKCNNTRTHEKEIQYREGKIGKNWKVKERLWRGKTCGHTAWLLSLSLLSPTREIRLERLGPPPREGKDGLLPGTLPPFCVTPLHTQNRKRKGATDIQKEEGKQNEVESIPFHVMLLHTQDRRRERKGIHDHTDRGKEEAESVTALTPFHTQGSKGKKRKPQLSS